MCSCGLFDLVALQIDRAVVADFFQDFENAAHIKIAFAQRLNQLSPVGLGRIDIICSAQLNQLQMGRDRRNGFLQLFIFVLRQEVAEVKTDSKVWTIRELS